MKYKDAEKIRINILKNGFLKIRISKSIKTPRVLEIKKIQTMVSNKSSGIRVGKNFFEEFCLTNPIKKI